MSGEEGEEEDEVRITYGEFKHGIQVSLKVKIYFIWILYLPQVGLRERLLFEAKTKYIELRGKEAPVKVEVKNEKAVEVTIFSILTLPKAATCNCDRFSVSGT